MNRVLTLASAEGILEEAGEAWTMVVWRLEGGSCRSELEVRSRASEESFLLSCKGVAGQACWTRKLVLV